MTFSPDGSLAYVTNSSTQGSVTVIDVATHAVIDTDTSTPGVQGISVGNFPRAVAFSPDATVAFVVNSGTGGNGSVSVIDTDPASATFDTVVDTIDVGFIPVDVAFSPDGSLAYLPDSSSGTVSVIDVANRRVIDFDPSAAGTQGIPVGSRATAVAVSPAGAVL